VTNRLTSFLLWTLFCSCSLVVTASAREPKGGRSTRLYTSPKAGAAGGIRAEVPRTCGRLIAAVAVNRHRPERVYAAQVAANGYGFSLRGLPVGMYDLALFFRLHFCEGMALHPSDDELTRPDLDAIEAVLSKTAMYFNEKRIHRCAGRPGDGGRARCVLQEIRSTRKRAASGTPVVLATKPRSFKLGLLADSGVGWEVVTTRELLRDEAGKDSRTGFLEHRYSTALSGIRVVDSVKQLGTLALDTAIGKRKAIGR